MKILGIEASGAISGAALLIDEHGPSTVELAGRGRHARSVSEAVAMLLQSLDLEPSAVDLVAVGRGPGSFTGVRVAMGVAKGFAVGRGIEIVGVSSLAAIAASACVEGSVVLAAADARRGEIYAGLFAPDPTALLPLPLSEEVAIGLPRLGGWLRAGLPKGLALTVAGDGAEKAAAALLDDPELELPVRLAAPEARRSAAPGCVARLGLARHRADGADDPEALDPVYIRPGVGG